MAAASRKRSLRGFLMLARAAHRETGAAILAAPIIPMSPVASRHSQASGQRESGRSAGFLSPPLTPRRSHRADCPFGSRRDGFGEPKAVAPRVFLAAAPSAARGSAPSPKSREAAALGLPSVAGGARAAAKRFSRALAPVGIFDEIYISSKMHRMTRAHGSCSGLVLSVVGAYESPLWRGPVLVFSFLVAPRVFCPHPKPLAAAPAQPALSLVLPFGALATRGHRRAVLVAPRVFSCSRPVGGSRFSSHLPHAPFLPVNKKGRASHDGRPTTINNNLKHGKDMLFYRRRCSDLVIFS
jgi:hypothetical protein